jgi:signal transduction histidine kinase
MNNELEPTCAAVDPNALHYQEIMFSIVMSVVAVLARDNPLVRFPDILWAFALLLAFNLGYHRLLRTRGGAVVPLVSMAVNVVLCSVVLSLSGGDQSNFWPLYILPSFTACLYLKRRHVIGACAAVAAFLALFYLEAFWGHRRWEACEFLMKLGVLGFSAAVTAHLSFKERGQRRDLAGIRERLETLSRSLERRSAADLMAMKKQSLDALIPGLMHTLNNPLGIIIGSVDLMLQDAPQGSTRRMDLERVRAAARRCTQIGKDLQSYLQSQEGARP